MTMIRVYIGFYCLLNIVPALSACSVRHTHSLTWHTPPDQWEQPRNFHVEFQPEFEDRIIINKGRWPDQVANPVPSPNMAYQLFTDPPDFTKDGPWNTKIYIDNERGTPLVVELREHARWEPQAEWINEKLVYVSVWWGRILGSYFIVDVEQEKIIFKEMVHDGQIAYQQYQQAKDLQP